MMLPTIEDIDLKQYLWDKGITDDEIFSYIRVNEKIAEYIEELVDKCQVQLK